MRHYSENLRDWLYDRHLEGGQAVELLGDGVMFHFPQPGDALACGLDLVDSADREGPPPARLGVNAGPSSFATGLLRADLNLAARIADDARPREVLASAAATDAAGKPDHEFEPIGEVTLRGVLEPVELFRVRNRDSFSTEEAVPSPT